MIKHSEKVYKVLLKEIIVTEYLVEATDEDEAVDLVCYDNYMKKSQNESIVESEVMEVI